MSMSMHRLAAAASRRTWPVRREAAAAKREFHLRDQTKRARRRRDLSISPTPVFFPSGRQMADYLPGVATALTAVLLSSALSPVRTLSLPLYTPAMLYAVGVESVGLGPSMRFI